MSLDIKITDKREVMFSLGFFMRNSLKQAYIQILYLKRRPKEVEKFKFIKGRVKCFTSIEDIFESPGSGYKGI